MRFGTVVSILCTVASVGSAQSGKRTDLTMDAAPVWFEQAFAAARISPSGRWVAYPGRPLRLYDLKSGGETHEPIWPGVDAMQSIAFGGNDEVFIGGRVGGQPGWFRHGPSGPVRISIPPDADPAWSADGSRVAYVRMESPDSGVFAGPLDHVRRHQLRGLVSAFAWTSSRDTLVAVARDTTGVSTLYKIELTSGVVRQVATDLDAVSVGRSPIAVAPDGRRVFIALAGDHRPSDIERQRPHTARNTSIYEIDLSNGRKHIVAAAEPGADLLGPSVAGGRLYWTRAETRAAVVTLPVRGGRVTTLVTNAAEPSWRPDGKQVGFYFGDWRVADWAINWDAGAIPVDASGVAAGPRAPLITNYAEDFEPEWSPRGTWIAYHSHRSVNPIPYYGAAGSSDDIWLRRVGAPPRDTADIRLTDFGLEAGSPSWSRDGTRLIFGAYDRKGVPGQNLLWLVTIDPMTGKPMRHSRVPVPPGVQSVSWAAWSPVSDDIAIEGEGSPPGRHALWVMRDSAHAKRITEYPMQTYGGVAWSPDGKTLIYSALVEKYNQLFSLAVTGGQPRRLTLENAHIMHPSVSPNGLVIAATRLEHSKTLVSVPLPR